MANKKPKLKDLTKKIQPFVFLILMFTQLSAQTDTSYFDLFDLSLEQLRNVKISSAAKTPEPVKDIPASITIISRSEIEKYGYATLPDLFRNIPGIYLLDNTESLFIGVRGTTGGGMQFMVNGIPQHPSLQKGLASTDISQFNIPIESIDRIEVIRGPMSVMYGNNAFQGVINIITNGAGDEKSLLSASYGSRNSGELFARYSNQFENGFFTINGGLYQTDGLSGMYSDMLDTTQLSNLHPSAVSSMDGEADHKHGNLDLSAKYKDISANFRYSKMDYGFYPTTVSLGGNNNIELTTFHGSLAYEKEFSEKTIFRATSILSTEEYNVPEVSIMLPSMKGSLNQTSRRSEIELNLIHRLKTIELIGGYRYRLIDNLSNTAYMTLAPGMPPLSEQNMIIDNIHTHELFTQASYQISPKLRLIAGLRYLRLPDSYIRTNTDSTGFTTEEVTPINSKDQLTGRIALQYEISNDHQIKLLIGTAAQDRDEFKFSTPEDIRSYELNYVYTHTNFQLSSSLFHNEIHHIIQRYVIIDTSNTKVDQAENSGKWNNYGLELIADYRVNNEWRIGSCLILQETIDQVNNIEIGYSPNIIAKFKTDYTVGSLNFGLNAYYISSMKTGFTLTDTDNNSSTPDVPTRFGDDIEGYFVLSANIRYNHEIGFFASINASNLLNTKFRYPANELANMTRGLIGMGQVISLKAGYQF